MKRIFMSVPDGAYWRIKEERERATDRWTDQAAQAEAGEGQSRERGEAVEQQAPRSA